ncbi:hypothetical protein GmHk_11G032602 [Glycine max]|nr:hypothetical protein GmHk_11G032602 [Glycine max]
MEENPNLEAQKFFDMLATAQAPLWEGCEHHSKLSASLAYLSLKSDYNMSKGCSNRMVPLMDDTMPKNNTMMVDRGRGGGHRTFNRGRRRGVSLGAPITINPSTSSIHISISESMIHVVALTPNILPTA